LEIEAPKMALLHASSLFLLSSHTHLESPCTTKIPFFTTQVTKLSLIKRGKGISLKSKAAVIENLHEEDVLLPKEPQEEAEPEREKYDWREEWYPLYLSAEVPDDAALGLTVFDKQVVLYKDKAGVVRCHEDRCPHRYVWINFLFCKM
jgi:Rieske [2Fe-2S] domain